MRTLPHQSNEQQKEAYHLLLKKEEEGDEEEEDAEKKAIPSRRSFNNYEEILNKQLLSGKLSSSLEFSTVSPKGLPTFIAPQGPHSLHLPHKKECRRGEDHGQQFDTKNDHNNRHLVPLCEDEASPFDPPKKSHSRVRFLLQSRPRKQKADAHPHPYKQIGSVNHDICGRAALRTISAYKVEGEKKRHSSASTHDMIRGKEAVMFKGSFGDVRPSSWEEEVRQAMARNSLSKRHDEEACQGGGLPRSFSVKEFGISTLPPTSIAKQPVSSHGNADVAICAEESEGKLMHDTIAGSCPPHHQGATEEKRMWKGFNVVKSPSEERWEEAAQDEEWQEMQRRARSQSMRYNPSFRTSDLEGIDRSEALGNGKVSYYNIDDEWAVYTRNAYINVRPRRSVDGRDAMPPCCSSLMGRSLSMRDTRMGLVMECAACGTALSSSGGCILCYCSCCALARASTPAGPVPTSHKKKGGGGILRACRWLLGLSKTRPMNH